MDKKQTIQHCQTPNNMTAEQNLDPIDVLVYTYLKAHMNQKTKQAFPSVRLLANETKLDIRTVQKCLNHLENAGDIIVHRSKGRPNVYEFNPKSKNFEMFSYKFLYENDNLTADERAYLIVTQQYMYKNDNSGYGKLSLTNKELSERINLSESAISRRHKTLQEKGVLTISDEFQKDCNSGLSLQLKIFDLTAIKQDMLFVKEKVAEHDLQLKEHNERLLKLEKENEGLYIYNLGTGHGYSVLDMVKGFEKATGKKVAYKIAPRRPGDIATCYADPSKAERELNWKAELGLKDMCRDAYNFTKGLNK